MLRWLVLAALVANVAPTAALACGNWTLTSAVDGARYKQTYMFVYGTNAKKEFVKRVQLDYGERDGEMLNAIPSFTAAVTGGPKLHVEGDTVRAGKKTIATIDGEGFTWRGQRYQLELTEVDDDAGYALTIKRDGKVTLTSDRAWDMCADEGRPLVEVRQRLAQRAVLVLEARRAGR